LYVYIWKARLWMGKLLGFGKKGAEKVAIA
jgi:hypothetical protein